VVIARTPSFRIEWGTEVPHEYYSFLRGAVLEAEEMVETIGSRMPEIALGVLHAEPGAIWDEGQLVSLAIDAKPHILYNSLHAHGSQATLMIEAAQEVHSVCVDAGLPESLTRRLLLHRLVERMLEEGFELCVNTLSSFKKRKRRFDAEEEDAKEAR
jgi:hypothetical protein